MHHKEVNKIILDSGNRYEENGTWVFSDGRLGKSSLRK